MTIAERKQNLRSELRRVLAGIPKNQKHQKSLLIFDKLLNDPFLKSAKTVLTFASTGNEPYTWDFIQNFKQYDKTFYLPVSLSQRVGKIDENLKLGVDGHCIFIPLNTVPLKEIGHFDLILVPGLGFDMQMHRLGHGGGWYDRALKAVTAKRIIGLCFKEQVVTALPSATFDVKVDQLITD